MMLKTRNAAGALAACLFSAVMILNSGCNQIDAGTGPDAPDGGNYVLAATYDSIRSFPGGGGIFVICMKPAKDFAGTVQLSLEADTRLKAELSLAKLHATDTATEILIHPDVNAAIGSYEITVVASHEGKDQKLKVRANLMEWQPPVFETALTKLDAFRTWLGSQNPAYLEVFNPQTSVYGTYPQILIVEHYTFITPRYEIRLCYHVMIPPYDWSMIRVRRRTSPVAELAARRESDGNISIISIQDYPTFYGY